MKGDSVILADQFDTIYDVVVLGFGGAGATAARFAADAGKQVLLVDAAPYGEEGGNTRYAGQAANFARDYDQMMTYYNRLTYPMTLPEDVKAAYVHGLTQNKAYFEKYLGVKPMASREIAPNSPLTARVVEYPEFPGHDTNDALSVHKGHFDAALWKILRQKVADRADRIDVWLDSPAKKLLQAADGTVVGVTILRNGELVQVAARHGVVLTMGGFENNQEMIQTYLGEAKLSPMGSLYNRGDGISMAERAGAKMWHMTNYESYSLMHGLYFAVPGAKRSHETYWEAGPEDGGVIVIGDDGTRYFNEAEVARHGHIYSHGSWRHAPLSVKPYMIFDQAQYTHFQAKPFKYIQLADLVIKADSIAALEQKLGLPQGNLTATIATYDRYAKAGKDEQFGRPAETMRPFGAGPYYAVLMVNTVLNTQGGPARNGKAEIIGQDNQPIPHLFGAGELGGITANLYQGAGNLAECLIFGKIAGENVAKTAPLSYPTPGQHQKINDLLSGDQLGEIKLGPNEYLGQSNSGMGGKLVVKVTYIDHTIKHIEIVQQHESEDVGLVALQQLPEEMVAQNNTEVDATTGASATSHALQAAVRDAISKSQQ